MPAASIHLEGPKPVLDMLRTGPVHEALRDIARLVDAELTVEAVEPAEARNDERPRPVPCAPSPHVNSRGHPRHTTNGRDRQNDATTEHRRESEADRAAGGATVCDAPPLDSRHLPPSSCLFDWPIAYRGRVLGHVRHGGNGSAPTVRQASGAIARITEHLVGREAAIDDLAEALMTGYEELDMLYALLPAVATRVRPAEIAQIIVDETARVLSCERVALLSLDETMDQFTVLASRGLPEEAKCVSIPLEGGAGTRARSGEDVLTAWTRDSLAKADRGAAQRNSIDSFVVARVPLSARGETLGFLTVTDRKDGGEFTARDLKLLDGLSAMGASALLGCRLHDSVNRQMLSAIQALASAVEAKDHYTRDHAGRVAAFGVATARQLGVTNADALRNIELAGLLHDIGKIGVPDAILGKTGRLTSEEFGVIQTHVRVGAEIVRHVEGLEDVARAILYHHERYDGMGYLAGLSRDDIPLASRLIAVADTFDSMTTDRPYRRAVSAEVAVSELRRCSGTQLDPDVVTAFLTELDRRPPSIGYR